jgi:hypothetical protein
MVNGWPHLPQNLQKVFLNIVSASSMIDKKSDDPQNSAGPYN